MRPILENKNLKYSETNEKLRSPFYLDIYPPMMHRSRPVVFEFEVTKASNSSLASFAILETKKDPSTVHQFAVTSLSTATITVKRIFQKLHKLETSVYFQTDGIPSAALLFEVSDFSNPLSKLLVPSEKPSQLPCRWKVSVSMPANKPHTCCMYGYGNDCKKHGNLLTGS